MNPAEVIRLAQDLENQFLSQDWTMAWYTASKLQNATEEIKWHCKAKEEAHLRAVALSRKV